MPPTEMYGALTPAVTPFHADMRPDAERLEQHCRWLLSQGAGLAVFGTNSEGNSLSVEEKIALLDHLVGAGIPPARMMPGTGHCAITDSARLTRHAVSLGCAGVLLLPPFYYKAVTDEGIFRAIAHVVDAVNDDRLKVYLYHIPPFAQVGFSLDLIERLIRAYPGIIAGIKDSSGDFANTRALLVRFPGWGVFCGNEANLVEARRMGAAGCISAICNVNPGAIARLADSWDAPDAAEQQARAAAIRKIIAGFPMIAALKALVSRFTEEPAWLRVRPPLEPLDDRQRHTLFEQMDALGFSMADGDRVDA